MCNTEYLRIKSPLLLVFIWILANKTLANEDGNLCPPNQHQHASSCIEFVEERKRFVDAEAECVQRGGHLVFIKDQGRNQFILDNLPTDDESWWIGLTDRENEGRHLWLDGSEAEYKNNDLRMRYSNFMDCVAIDARQSWMARHCMRTSWYICEYNIAEIIRVYVPSHVSVYPTGETKIVVMVAETADSTFRYDIDSGDGYHEDDVPLEPGMNNLTHTYTPGCYNVTLRVFTLSYDETWNKRICVEEMLGEVEVKVYTVDEEEITVDGLRTGMLVIFKAFADVSDESIQRTEWEISSNLPAETVSLTTPESSINFTFDMPGEYIVTATVVNRLSRAAANISLTVVGGDHDLVLIDSGPVAPGREITLAFYTSQVQDETQYTIDLGDGSVAKLDQPIPVGPDDVSYQNMYKSVYIHEYEDVGVYTVTVAVSHEDYHEVITTEVYCLAIQIFASQLGADLSDGMVARRAVSISFRASVSEPVPDSSIRYIVWRAGGESLVTRTLHLPYTFHTVGVYEVNATAYSHDNVSITADTRRLTVMDPVEALYLINDGPADVDELVTMVLFTSHLGTDATYVANLGDGTVTDIPFPEMKEDIQRYIPSSVNFIFNTKDMLAAVFTHSYSAKGTFTVEVTASNPINSQSASTDVFIVGKYCQLPRVHIFSNSENVTEVVSYKRSVGFVLSGKVELDCRGDTSTVFNWTAHRVEDVAISPDGSNIYRLPPTTGTSSTNLVVPPHSLEYGLYVFKLTVSVVDQASSSVLTSNNDGIRIRIVPSPLIAKIRGGSARTFGWSSQITLDGSESRDPDYPNDADDIEYKWYCRKTSDQPFSFSMSHRTGGCFGDGVYLSGYTGQSITLEAETLGFSSYVFRLEVTLAGREGAIAEQMITILPGSPLTLGIRCVQNCDVKVNPSRRLALSVDCQDCSPSQKPRYKWALYDDDEVDDVMMAADIESMTTTGVAGRNIVFKAGVFSRSAQETYFLRITGSVPGRTEGNAHYSFVVNTPPAAGSCAVSPSTGYVLETPYSIHCDGFVDEDTPLTYEFSAITGAERTATVSSLESVGDRGTILFSGQHPILKSTYLPVGTAKHQYRVDIAVKVADVYGSSVRVVTSTTVKETRADHSGTEVQETLMNLTTSESSPLKTLLEAGDTQTATQILNSMSSVLNAQSDAVLTENVTHTEETLKRHTQIRTAIVKTLSNIPVETVAMLQQTSAAITLATQEKTEISRETQLAAASTYTRLGSFLKSQSTSIGGEVVESTAKTLIAGLSNIMEASLGVSDPADDRMRGNYTDMIDGDDGSGGDTGQQGRNVTLSTFTALEDVQSAILVNKVVGEPPTVLRTPALALTLDKMEAASLDGAAYKDAESDVGYRLPGNSSLLRSFKGNYTDVNLQLLHMPQNPFNWDSSSTDVKDAIIGLQMSTGDQAIQVSNASEEIEFFLPQSPQKTEKNTFTVEYSNDTRIVTHFNISVAGASVLVGIETGETNLKFGLYLRYNSKPSLADFLETVHLSLEKGDNGTASGGNDGQHVWSVSPDYLQEAGTYYILVRIDGAADGQNISLDIFTVTSACLYWDGTRELWSGDGCRVGRLTALSYTHCLCNHLTVFGMSMFVMPNTVDFVKDAKLFLTFVDNPVVVSTVGAVFLVYLVLAVFARKKDEKDRALATVSILDDNDPFALYRYDVTIHTGYRRGAGTSATVTITLYGTESQSEPHVLRDKTRQVLQRGETDSFLVTTSRSMGDVEAIRLWHDNSGDYPEWFVGHVIVHDLETDQRWYFLCNSWLAVDVGQGLIDRYFRVACEDDLRKFKHLFITKTAKDLRDRHLWFSILGRPARSNFTRLQRLSCALSLLLCSMLASIMFYGVPTDPHDQKMDFGVFSFTWQQLIIGIESSIVVFPVNLLIVQIFRYTEPRPQETRVESVEDCDLSKSGISVGRYQSFESLSLEICSLTEVEEDESSPLSCLETDELTELDSVSQMLQNSIISSENRQLGVPDDTRSDETISEELKIEDKSMVLESGHTLPSAVSEDSVVNFSSLQIMSSEISQDTRETSCRCHVSSRLPWWFVYVGWLLVAATSLVSAYYVMLYGLKYGKKRSIDWLVSMFVSILDSVFVEQPITVILVAAFTAFVFKTMDEEDDGSQHIEEIPLSVDNLNSLERRHEDILQHRLHEKIYSPPEQETVDIYRQRKEITKKIYALLREIFGYLIFIWLLLVIAHGQRDKQAYYMSRNVENIFFNNKNFKIWLHEYSTFFNWTYERLLPGLHGDEPGFISDQASKLVGVARLRQIRNKKGSCSMVESANITISQCHGEYSRGDEDTSSYLASWQPSPGNRSAIKDPASPWSYQKSVSIPYWGQAAIYSGGGYVADLATDRVKSVETINYLRDRVWLDDQTRALFVEFTLYNANANLFGMVTLLIERPGIGGLLKKYEILTMKFYRYSADFMLFVMTCEIVYILFILFFMFVEGKQMYLLGREYFKNVWNWLELLIILASWSAIAIYIMRQVIADRTLQEYSDTPDQFISFHTAAMLAQTLEYVIALLVLLGTLKLLHLLRINPRIYLLTSALKSASKELGGFFAMLAVTFTAFACTAYVLLGAGVRGFQNLLLAYESLFSLMLGYVDEETRKFNPLFSAFLVITFVILTLFFIINLFIALIIEALLNVRHNHQQSPDEKIVDQLITKLTSVFTAPKRSKN